MTNHLHDALFLKSAFSDAPLLHLPDGSVITRRAFSAHADDLSSALASAGVACGDRVAAQVEKSATSLALYAACLRIGAVFLPLNTSYTDDEVGFFLTDCAARVLICDPARVASLARVAEPAGTRVITMAADGTGGWRDLCHAPSPRTAERGGDDIAAILYTSGTTGRPKGAILSHDNLLSNAATLVDAWGVTDADRLLHALPVFHSHGLFVAGNVCLLAGAQMLYLPKFDADSVIAAMPDCTMMMGVPTFYTRLLASDDFTAAVCHHMRLFISGSAPLLEQTHAAFSARTGHRILERFGLTETSMNTSNPFVGDRKPGTVGRPLPGVDLRINTGGTGAVGEIEVRGPNVFQGYWGLPDQTAEAFTDDGYFRTGDLGTIDEDGYLTIVGRSKDLIISGGLNIYPKEIEKLIDAQPGVDESAVIGLPDPDFGERVVAMVVETSKGALDTQLLQETLRARLARFKLPKRIVVVDSLPRNVIGKVQKNVMRQDAVAAGW